MSTVWFWLYKRECVMCVRSSSPILSTNYYDCSAQLYLKQSHWIMLNSHKDYRTSLLQAWYQGISNATQGSQPRIIFRRWKWKWKWHWCWCCHGLLAWCSMLYQRTIHCIPGYPRVDVQKTYKITRYDGTVINAQHWGFGGY